MKRRIAALPAIREARGLPKGVAYNLSFVVMFHFSQLAEQRKESRLLRQETKAKTKLD